MKADMDRRKFLMAAGATAATVAVAGCSGGGNGDDGGDDGGGAPDNVPESVHTYLTDNDANLYDNSVEDHTGEDSVTVMNGAGSNNVAFDAAAIRIDAGTEVTWEWTGLGGSHNVVSRDQSDFDFENPEGLLGDEGHTWSYTFEESGNAVYHCEAHTAQGQHGAVIVE
jgi:halocyanin-like protein